VPRSAGRPRSSPKNMFEMSRLESPVICVVIGEGGSGGALGIGVGDKVAMLEHAYYSVISPEGCAGILWKSHTYAEQAAQSLKMTSKDLSRLKVIDDVIEEPLGGAHRDHHQMAGRLKLYLVKCLRELTALSERSTGRRPLRKVPPDGRLFGRRRLKIPVPTPSLRRRPPRRRRFCADRIARRKDRPTRPSRNNRAASRIGQGGNFRPPSQRLSGAAQRVLARSGRSQLG